MGSHGKHPPHPELPPPPPRFVCKNNGVLFENQLLQIGVKSEFRQNLGVLGDCGVGVSRRPGLGGRAGRGCGNPDETWPLPTLQAACISSMATRPRCSSRTSRPLWSTLETSRLISSGLAPRPQPCPPGLPSWPLGRRWTHVQIPVWPSYLRA